MSAALSERGAGLSPHPCLTLFQVTLSRIMNSLSAVAAAAGTILLIVGFLIDRDFLCGYSGEASECHAVTTLFIVSVMHL